LVVVLRLDPIGLGLVPMLLCLPPVFIDVADSDLGQVIMQLRGRVVDVGARPAGRGGVSRGPQRRRSSASRCLAAFS
jgi:hypothetical protein